MAEVIAVATDDVVADFVVVIVVVVVVVDVDNEEVIVHVMIVI